MGKLLGPGDLLGHEDRRDLDAEVEAGQVGLPFQLLFHQFQGEVDDLAVHHVPGVQGGQRPQPVALAVARLVVVHGEGSGVVEALLKFGLRGLLPPLPLSHGVRQDPALVHLAVLEQELVVVDAAAADFDALLVAQVNRRLEVILEFRFQFLNRAAFLLDCTLRDILSVRPPF
jgi:hypothetical protein